MTTQRPVVIAGRDPNKAMAACRRRYGLAPSETSSTRAGMLSLASPPGLCCVEPLPTAFDLALMVVITLLEGSEMLCPCGGIIRETTSVRKNGTRTDTRWCEACTRTERRMRWEAIDTGWNAPSTTVGMFAKAGGPMRHSERTGVLDKG